MQQAMERGAGIYRDEAGLSSTAAKIAELGERSRNIWLDDRSLTFNTELIALLELSNMLDVCEAILHSARARHESRGAHQRTDHPQRDDERFLAHSLAYRQGGQPPAAQPHHQRLGGQVEPGDRVEEQGGADQHMEGEDGRGGQEAQEAGVGRLPAPQRPDLGEQQDGGVAHRQAGELAGDELGVGEPAQPPEDRHAVAMPLRVMRPVGRVHRLPHGMRTDRHHSAVAWTL